MLLPRIKFLAFFSLSLQRGSPVMENTVRFAIEFHSGMFGYQRRSNVSSFYRGPDRLGNLMG